MAAAQEAGIELRQSYARVGKPAMAPADRGCRGVVPPNGARPLNSHTRGLPPLLKRPLKHRQAIEPIIGPMKTNGPLASSWLEGSDGDAIHAVQCEAGHNLRLISTHLRVRATDESERP